MLVAKCLLVSLKQIYRRLFDLIDVCEALHSDDAVTAHLDCLTERAEQGQMRVVVNLANVPMEVGVDGALVRIEEPVARAVELVSEVCHHQRQIGMLRRGQLLHVILGHDDGHVALIAHY